MPSCRQQRRRIAPSLAYPACAASRPCPCSFAGVYDVRQAVAAAEQGRVLHPLVLGAIATTLAAAARLEQQLGLAGGSADGGPAAFPALQQLAGGLGGALPRLRAAIEQCIGEGRVLDAASPALGEVREARRANRAALRSEMERWARALHQAGVSERAQVVVRRDRQCIPVRRGRQGELPKGSVTLAASESGNTLYMEPQVGAGRALGGDLVWAGDGAGAGATAGPSALLLPRIPGPSRLQLPCPLSPLARGGAEQC